MIRNATPKIK